MTRGVFHFITLFPELISPWLHTSILGRAHEEGLFEFHTYPLRDFATDKHRTVDDLAYGGGGGMVLKIEPIVAAIEHVRARIAPAHSITLYFSPAGKPLTHGLVGQMAENAASHFILLCGRYEGLDQRVIDGWVDREISLGDFVVTGGELPALAFADAVIRQWGALGCPDGEKFESFALQCEKGPLLEYPHYTRPAEFRGRRVPEVLLKGDHGEVDRWRRDASLRRTSERRPDLWERSGVEPGSRQREGST